MFLLVLHKSKNSCPGTQICIKVLCNLVNHSLTGATVHSFILLDKAIRIPAMLLLSFHLTRNWYAVKK